MKYCFIFLFTILLYSCNSHPEHNKYESYTIQSIRIDDDAEYHIVAIGEDGSSIECSDADNGFDIYIKYENIDIPRIIRKYTDKNAEEYQYHEAFDVGYPKVILPIGYKVETFED